MYSVIDSVCDQPIFFLISQTEDFPDLSCRKMSDTQEQETVENVTSKLKKLNIENETSEGNSDTAKTKKPFTFSDFKNLTSDVCERGEEEEESAEKPKTESNMETAEEIPVCANEEEKTVLDDDVESVYMMASSRSIDSVVEEYIKRKKTCTMLPSSNHSIKKRPSFSVYSGNGNVEPLPPEIEQQRKSSINKVSVQRKYVHCF